MSTPWWTSYFSCRPRRMAMVSSTVGSLTSTFWKRRSSAASFSTYLRYSSSVVAPTQCSSQRAHVERQDALALEHLGHFAVDDSLREALDNRGLAHARLADEHGVVLGAAGEHLDGAANLVIAADHRVELAAGSTRSEVDGVLL